MLQVVILRTFKTPVGNKNESQLNEAQNQEEQKKMMVHQKNRLHILLPIWYRYKERKHTRVEGKETEPQTRANGQLS